jgi:hypothetical protein
MVLLVKNDGAGVVVDDSGIAGDDTGKMALSVGVEVMIWCGGDGTLAGMDEKQSYNNGEGQASKRELFTTHRFVGTAHNGSFVFTKML